MVHQVDQVTTAVRRTIAPGWSILIKTAVINLESCKTFSNFRCPVVFAAIANL